MPLTTLEIKSPPLISGNRRFYCAGKFNAIQNAGIIARTSVPLTREKLLGQTVCVCARASAGCNSRVSWFSSEPLCNVSLDQRSLGP